MYLKLYEQSLRRCRETTPLGTVVEFTKSLERIIEEQKKKMCPSEEYTTEPRGKH